MRGQQVAFELFSDVCPRRCNKWEQPPNMFDGVNMRSSMVETNPPGIVRADDFVSDGRAITDIHWWGSYLWWKYLDPGGETNPVPPPSDGTNEPLGFYLSWHAESNCLPGLALTLEPRLAPQGIRVHAICPAAIDTDMMRTSLTARAVAMGQPVEQALAGINLGAPRGVARVLAFLASADAAFVRGTVYTR